MLSVARLALDLNLRTTAVPDNKVRTLYRSACRIAIPLHRFLALRNSLDHPRRTSVESLPFEYILGYTACIVVRTKNRINDPLDYLQNHPPSSTGSQSHMNENHERDVRTPTLSIFTTKPRLPDRSSKTLNTRPVGKSHSQFSSRFELT